MCSKTLCFSLTINLLKHKCWWALLCEMSLALNNVDKTFVFSLFIKLTPSFKKELRSYLRSSLCVWVNYYQLLYLNWDWDYSWDDGTLTEPFCAPVKFSSWDFDTYQTHQLHYYLKRSDTHHTMAATTPRVVIGYKFKL